MVPVLVAGAFGLFNGSLIAYFKIQPIIATLVLFIAGRGIAQVVTNGNLQPFSNAGFQYIGLGRPFGTAVSSYSDAGYRRHRRLGAARDDLRALCAGGGRQRVGGAPGGRAGQRGSS